MTTDGDAGSDGSDIDDSKHEQNGQIHDIVRESTNKEPALDGSMQDVFRAKSGVPVDRGWAWIVLAASWCNMFVLLGTYRSFGVLFIEIQNRFDSSSSITSLISSLLNAIYAVTALLVTTVGLRYFSERQFIICGGVVLCSAYLLSAFSSDVRLLILFIGCMSGIGHGLVYTPTISLLSQYFNKYRSLANCIAFTGGSVGALVLSILIPMLVEKYAFQGAVVILAGMALQVSVSGSVMRPVSYYTSNTNNVEDKSDTAPEVKQNIQNGDTVARSLENFKENGHTELMDKKDTLYGIRHNEDSTSLLNIRLSPLSLRVAAARNRRIRTVSELSKSSLAKSVGSHLSMLNNSNISRYASTEFSIVSIVDPGVVYKSQEIQNYDEDKKRCSFCQHCSNLRSVLDCGAMRKYAFRCYLPFGCMLVSLSSVQIFLPVLAKDEGISSQKSSLLITFISVTDTCCIILWGIFADKQYLSRNKLISLAAMAVGITIYFSPMFHTFPAFIACSIIYGLFGRVFFSLYPVMLVDYIGLENLRSAIGIVGLFQTTSTAVIQPVIGMMRDTTGSYIPGMLLLASSIIFGAVGLLFLPLAEEWEHKRRNATSQIHTDEP